MIRRRLRITGRVQGVFYRKWMVGEATALGLTGWVRNRADGSVEAIVDGPPDAVAEIVRRAADGPPAARVDEVSAEDVDRDEVLTGFEMRPTP